MFKKLPQNAFGMVFFFMITRLSWSNVSHSFISLLISMVLLYVRDEVEFILDASSSSYSKNCQDIFSLIQGLEVWTI